LDMKIVLAVVLVLAIGGVAAMTLQGGGSQGTTSSTTTPPSSTSTTTSGSTPIQTTTAGQEQQETPSGLEGEWRGIYESNYGRGEWTWIIRQASDGSYEGCIRVSGPYDTGGDWIPLTIQVEGDTITLGTVGGVQVTFTGKVAGDSVSGTWSLAGGQDGGGWSGQRVGPASDLPCMSSSGGSGTTYPGEEATTTTSQPYTTTIVEEVCTPTPPPQYAEAYQSVMSAVEAALPGVTLKCYMQNMVGTMYVVVFNMENYDPGMAYEAAQALVEAMNASGWYMPIIMNVQDGTFIVSSISYMDTGIAVEVSVVEGEWGMDLTVQLVSAAG